MKKLLDMLFDDDLYWNICTTVSFIAFLCVAALIFAVLIGPVLLLVVIYFVVRNSPKNGPGAAMLFVVIPPYSQELNEVRFWFAMLLLLGFNIWNLVSAISDGWKQIQKQQQ